MTGHGDEVDLQWGPDGTPAEPSLLLVHPTRVPVSDRIVIVVADASTAPAARAAADVLLAPAGSSVPGAVECDDPIAAAADLVAAIDTAPVPAVALAWHLRATHGVPVEAALVAESALYSALLAGSDFARWLAARGPVRRAADAGHRVRAVRDGDRLTITLARPGRRNAVDAAMRDALVEALQVARWDEGVQVLVDAEGPAFSAGGDLDEFGTATDPARAHLVRVAAGAARILHELRDRVTVRVHGPCVGAGCELPAFAGRVVAAPDATFRLPELALGLIPGAGGTVSLPRRIGRARTAWLALTGEPIDARTALAWGLVDAVEPGP